MEKLRPSNNLRIALAIAISAIILVTTSSYAFGLLSKQKTVTTIGTVTSADIGVYKDSACTQNLTSIDWHLVYPGSNVTTTAYIRNLGNANISLQLETTNWSPSTASNILSLSWDYAGQIIRPNEAVKAVLTLSIPSDAGDLKTFSFNIIVTSYTGQ